MVFRLDMSPLERSSMAMPQALANIGASIRGGIKERQARNQMQEIQELGLSALKGDQDALQALQVKNPQAGQRIQQMLQKQQMQKDVSDFFANPQSGTADASRILATYPEMANQLAQPLQNLSEERKQDELRQSMQILAAVESGQPELAKEMLQERAQSYRNAGDEMQAKVNEGLIPKVDEDQEKFKKSMYLILGSNMNPDEYAEFSKKIGGKDSSAEKKTANIQDYEYYSDLKKTDPEGAKAFGQDVGLVSKEGRELPPHLQKRLSEATDAAIESGANAAEYQDLANQIRQADISGGLKGVWTQSIKDLTGSQDYISQLRRKYYGIRASEAVKNLPPGVASDKDIEMAMKGFPPDTASGEEISSFLKGMAKLNERRSEYESFKAEFISDEGSERDMWKKWKKRNQETDIPIIKTQAEFDKLSSGSIYIEDGKRYRKP